MILKEIYAILKEIEAVYDKEEDKLTSEDKRVEVKLNK